MTWKPPAPGALDDTAWPEQLVGKAVLPGANDDRFHGYEVLGDLARHYSYSDVVYLAIVGELPDDRASRLFHCAMCSFATLPVTEAPGHVAVLARICGSTLASAIGVGALTLADQSREMVSQHAALLVWLASPTAQLPPEHTTTADASWVRALCEAAGDTKLVRPEMTRDAARIALLFEAGLRTREQLEAAVISSRISGLLAETLKAGPADLKLYPVKLPPFQYVEDAP
jgi:hypothetical protein